MEEEEEEKENTTECSAMPDGSLRQRRRLEENEAARAVDWKTVCLPSFASTRKLPLYNNILGIVCFWFRRAADAISRRMTSSDANLRASVLAAKDKHFLEYCGEMGRAREGERDLGGKEEKGGRI